MGFILIIMSILTIGYLLFEFVIPTTGGLIVFSTSFISDKNERENLIENFGSLVGFGVGLILSGVLIFLIYNYSSEINLLSRPNGQLKSSSKILILILPFAITFICYKFKRVASWIVAISTVILLIGLVSNILYFFANMIYQWVIK